MRRIGYDATLAARIDEVPVPEPAPGEVLIRVEAIGLTLPGVRMLRRADAGTWACPGGEIAGVVTAVADAADSEQAAWLGARVVGLSFGPAHAEFATAPLAFCARVPDGVDLTTAVAALRGGQVALGTLAAGAPAAGETVLVTAAAGAIGHLAVQLARGAGAGRVIGAVGSLTKAAFVRGLGADDVVSYDGLAETAPVDVVVEGVGGDVLRAAVGALAPGGRVVSFSAAGGEVEANTLRDKAASLIGFQMARIASGSPELYARRTTELWQALSEGRLRPAIHAELPFERATEAHLILQERANLGKVLLRARE